MTKKDVLEKMKALGLPKGSYVVYGSAPFAIYGIRDVNDIDLLVAEDVYEKLKNKVWKKVYKGEKDEPLVHDIYEAHPTWEFSPYAPTLQELLSRAIEVDGITFAALEDVRKWKEASGRPKDLVDLQLIDDYLKQRKSAFPYPTETDPDKYKIVFENEGSRLRL